MENGKNNIIARIARDTDEKISQILADADAQLRQIEADAQKDADLAFERAQKKVENNAAELERRANVSVQLDCKKYRLNKRQQLVTRVFDEVRSRILALPRAQYLAFWEKRLAQFAEKGESLVVCSRDRDVFTSALAQKYSLTLADGFGNFDGGFMLVGCDYEKDVTLDTLIAEARNDCEREVVAVLFG